MNLGWLAGSMFLGWSLGANDASLVFGTAVGSRAVSFRTAVICICVFCLLGAGLEGPKCFDKLNTLTTMNQTFASAFIITVASAVAITLMTILKIPASTTQTVSGAIIGAGIATVGIKGVNIGTLTNMLACWIGTPVGAMIISYVMYFAVGPIWNLFYYKNIVLMDRILKIGLIVSGSYGAYALGANNVGNVVALFANVEGAHWGNPHILALLGAAAICFGVITYSKGVMETVGGNLVPLVPFTAFIAVLASAATVHVYTMIGVPVSTGQAVVGAVLGIGLVKGMKSVNNKVFVGIGVAMVVTPSIAAVIAYYFMKYLLPYLG